MPEPDLPATEWNPPEPQQMPTFRDDLLDIIQRPMVLTNTAIALENGNGTIRPDMEDTDVAAALMLHDEKRRLEHAQLYSVTDEMTQVADRLGTKLKAWEVRRDDLPSLYGLMVFGEPIGSYPSHFKFEDAKKVDIIAVSWGPSLIVPRSEESNFVWLTFWSLHNHEVGVSSIMKHNKRITLREAREMQHAIGDYAWDDEALLSFEASHVRTWSKKHSREFDSNDGHVAKPTTAAWVQTVRATWLLMKSQKGKNERRIADVEDVPLRRNLRRRLEREGLPTSPVQVVHLHKRNERTTTREHASGYTVKVRSVVTGHVRMQPYRSRGVVEPIWIEDHVRGPDGAPFSQKREKVHVLDRPPGGRPPQQGN